MATQPLETKKLICILIADDDPDDRQMTKEALEESNLLNDLQFVEDGVELMDYLHRNGKYADVQAYPEPGLILLDLNMPRKDGREALREIKSNPRFRHIPVIILTTSNSEVDVVRSYDFGSNCFITKPVTFTGLLEVARSIGQYWFGIVALPESYEDFQKSIGIE